MNNIDINDIDEVLLIRRNIRRPNRNNQHLINNDDLFINNQQIFNNRRDYEDMKDNNIEVDKRDSSPNKKKYKSASKKISKKQALSNLKKVELLTLCRKKHISGYSRLNKNKLVNLLLKYY